MTTPRFKYGQRVRVIRGEYEGAEGILFWMQPPKRGQVSRRVGIRLSDGSVAWANDTNIALVVEREVAA